MESNVDTKLLSCLSLITSSSNVNEIRRAWEELIKLNEENDLNNIVEILKIIIKKPIQNVDEIPKLLKFFSPIINSNPFEVNNGTSDMNNSYTKFLKHIVQESKNLNSLCDTIDVLIQKRNIYLPNYECCAEFCKGLVHCLSLCNMPCKENKVNEFKSKTKIVHASLLFVTNSGRTRSQKDSLIGICMDTLYKILTETDQNPIPGAALAVVIRLIETDVISDAINTIIVNSSSDQHLSRLVCILCQWLTQWLKDETISLWIQKFIEGLHNERRFSALHSISNNYLKTMLRLLKFPIARLHLMPIVHSMLIHMGTPKLFHDNIDQIKNLLVKLSNENSQVASIYIQDLVNCVCVLMARFPGHDCYESLEQALPFQPKEDVVIKLLNVPQWIENNKIILNNYKSISRNNKHVGLINLGNTCYMNSVLQALLMTPKFCDQILTYNEDSIGKNGILSELQRLFALLLYSQRPYLSPIDFLRASRPKYFTPGQQQDSAEFLCHLLDVLYEQERPMITQSNMSYVTINDKSPNNSSKFKLQRRTISTEDNNSNNCDVTNYNIQSNITNSPSNLQACLVHRVFGGETNTTYQCNKCYTSSHNIDHYWELQLSFPEEIDRNREISVKDLINYYLTPEKLTGDNMYHCDRCSCLCDAQRIIKISRAPAHLILTLKHFHYDIDSGLKNKLFHKVTYNETIQIPVLVDDHNVVETYQLYAAVVHCGYSMDYGHYFTYARDRTKQWYKFNDSYVYGTTLNELTQLPAPYTPYILFYEKIVNNMSNELCEKPKLPTISKNIRNIIALDTTKYVSEQNNFKQNQISQISNDDHYQVSTSSTQQRDSSDDDNPPPANCRDSVSMQPNRFLY